jgi:hypothetical protein
MSKTTRLDAFLVSIILGRTSGRIPMIINDTWIETVLHG